MNLALDITNKHQEKFEDTKRAIRGVPRGMVLKYTT